MTEKAAEENSTVEEERYDNPLGFTRETGALLSGLGITNLSKFKKKEINLDDLKDLTEKDLKLLGVDDNVDYESYKKLVFNLKKKYRENKPSAEDILQILGSNSRQLQVLHLYLKYLNAKLTSPDLQDFFIDRNKNLKASEVLIEEVKCLFDELKELEKTCDNFKITKGKRSSNKLKYSFVIGGISVILLAYGYKRIYL